MRFFILRAHYRSPLNYSDAHLDDAKGALTRLYTALKNLPSPASGVTRDSAALPPSRMASSSIRGAGGEGVIDWDEPYPQRFKAAMDDDLNTPEAVAVLFDLANEVNRTQSAQATTQLKALSGVLGLLQRDPREFLQGESGAGGLDDAAINAQIEARIAAKKSKNFAEADRIRKELLEAGVVLEDTPQGTGWRRA